MVPWPLMSGRKLADSRKSNTALHNSLELKTTNNMGKVNILNETEISSWSQSYHLVALKNTNIITFCTAGGYKVVNVTLYIFQQSHILLCVELFWGNITMYLHIMNIFFLQNEMAQVVKFFLTGDKDLPILCSKYCSCRLPGGAKCQSNSTL